MEMEFKLLQEKVNYLEEALNYVEAETSQKLRVLAEMITKRAELAQSQRKGLQEEEHFCQHLLTQCNWTSFADHKADLTNKEQKQQRNPDLETKIKSNLILRRSSIFADKNVENLVGSHSMQKLQNQQIFSCSSEVCVDNHLNNLADTQACPDPLSVVSLDFGNSDPSLTVEYDVVQHNASDTNATNTPENLLASNPTVSVTLNTSPFNSQSYEIANVDFQQKYYVGGQVVEEIEQMQTLQSEDPEIQGSSDWGITSKDCVPVEVDMNEDIVETGQHSNNQELSTRAKPHSFHPNPTFVRHTQQQSYGSTATAPRSKKQNKCKLCPAAFTLRRTLFMHMMTFHKTPQSQLPIQFQSIKPTPTDELRLPVVSSYEPGNNKPQKRLFCKYPHCQKSYASTQNLKIHMRTHTGERPHICSLCQKAFADPSCLRRHTLFYHGMANNGNSTSS